MDALRSELRFFSAILISSFAFEIIALNWDSYSCACSTEIPSLFAICSMESPLFDIFTL